VKNVLTIARRELGAYFTSPVGYIFMIVFIAISVGLYITTFFTFPVADMRSYFGNLPVLLCVFIPAITMRVWAEERKENTWELLLTFPMRAWELSIGKFLASLAFFALTLASTLTVPAMLIALGDPDGGAIFSAYLGTLLLGAYFLSIGIFFSGFCKDQIVAFVVTLLACFGIFLMGTGFIAAYIDDLVPGWGSMLGELVGLSDHYSAFTRGVIEMADVLYFVAWTAVFLTLNIIFIDGRSRPKARLYFSGTVVGCVLIGLLGNWLIRDMSLLRLDMTEGKVFTISQASKNILSTIDTPVQVKLYVTPKRDMPTGLANFEQDVTDKLDELRVASGGNVQYSVVHLTAANAIDGGVNIADGSEPEEEEEGEEEALEKRMLDKGIRPHSVQSLSQDQMTNKLIYSSIGIGYKEKQEEILPDLMPQDLMNIEYRLVSTIFKLTQEEPPVVVIVAPQEQVAIDPQMRMMMQQMGQQVPEPVDPYSFLQRILESEKYSVQRVEISPQSPLPEEFDTLVVADPRKLSDRQRWEISRALASGKSVVMAVQNREFDYQATRQGLSLNQRDEAPAVNPLLEKYGITVSADHLMDVNHVALNVSSGGGGGLAALLNLGQPIDLPTHMLINNETMDQDTSITSRLSTVFYLWGSRLVLDEDKFAELGIDVKTLMRTTENAWTAPAMSQEAIEQPDSGEAFPIMVLASGQFPDAYAGQDRPTWPPPAPSQFGQPTPPPPVETGEPDELVPAPGKLVVIGGAEMWRDNFINPRSGGPGNYDLFLNTVDAVTLGDDLLNVRGHKPIDRIIASPSAGTKTRWKLINYGFAISVISIAGIVTTLVRRRSRNAYTLAHNPG
jgi:ABC-type transport system involved in multi-copper enzyme maturation permease subunit